MGDIAIRVKNVSKQYRIGVRQEYQDTLRDHLTHLAKKMIQPRRQTHLSEDTIWALKGISFEVTKGEVLGVIGRNGAGKTTLLKILSRITEPTEGFAEVHGRIGSLLEVGTGFHPELTGRENIYLNGAILGMGKVEIRRKFDEIVAFAEMEKFLDTPVKRYSSGMYVRLAFAVAAHLEPEILLVDEVLAVGDATFQKKCLGKMDNVTKEGRTVLFVSHNMSAIESLCNRALWLDSGMVAKAGQVQIVVSSYYRKIFEQTQMELKVRPDRVSSGETRLISLKVMPVEDSSDGIRCDTRIQIIIDYIASSQLQKYAFLLGILDQRGVSIYWLDSRYEPSLPAVLSAIGRVKCITAPLNLVPGTYYINAAMIKDGEVVDQVESALSFIVEQNDFFGVGRIHTSRHGICLIPQVWQVIR